MSNEKTWTISLNQYERNNLLWLFRVIGWDTHNRSHPLLEALHTGEWVGGIGFQLQDPDGWYEKEIDRAVKAFISSFEAQVIAHKLKNKVKEA